MFCSPNGAHSAGRSGLMGGRGYVHGEEEEEVAKTKEGRKEARSFATRIQGRKKETGRKCGSPRDLIHVLKSRKFITVFSFLFLFFLLNRSTSVLGCLLASGG